MTSESALLVMDTWNGNTYAGSPLNTVSNHILCKEGFIALFMSETVRLTSCYMCTLLQVTSYKLRTI